MVNINIFYIIVILVAGGIIFLANNFTKETDAIIAQVEPQRIAISYQKPVRINTLHVVPGQDVIETSLYLVDVLEGDARLIYKAELWENAWNYS